MPAAVGTYRYAVKAVPAIAVIDTVHRLHHGLHSVVPLIEEVQLPFAGGFDFAEKYRDLFVSESGTIEAPQLPPDHRDNGGRVGERDADLSRLMLRRFLVPAHAYAFNLEVLPGNLLKMFM